MKRLLILIFAISISMCSAVYAQDKGVQNPDLKQINTFLDKFLKYSNDHNEDGIKNLYAPNYISGDGIKKDQLMSMIKDTWNTYSDIKYSSEVKDIRINNNSASVESYDKAVSTSGKRSAVTGDTGLLESYSHNIVYLKKIGKEWKIITDKVNYENTIIKYGTAKGLNIRFQSPEQVFAGEEYTASLYSQIPSRSFALGSITRAPIVYPETKAEEVFRQIPADTGLLERVIKANNTNNNELVSASVGFTEVSGEDYNSPELKLSGLAVLLQRVNVIPKSTFVEVKSKTEDDQEDEDILPPQTPPQIEKIEPKKIDQKNNAK